MTVSSPQSTLLLVANTKHVPISYTEQMSTTVVYYVKNFQSGIRLVDIT